MQLSCLTRILCYDTILTRCYMKNNLLSKILGFIFTSAISFILVFTLFSRNQVIAKEDEQLISIN